MNSTELIETGKIVNTHGVRGEVKIEPWADSPDVVAALKTLYIGGKAVTVLRSRVHKGMVIAALDGICDMDAAEALKTKTVFAARGDIALPEGKYFIADLVGKKAVDCESGDVLGTVTDIIDLPSGSVAEIRGEREILVPIRPEFVVSQDGESIKIRLIEGM